MGKEFDKDAAKRHLQDKNQQEKETQEVVRAFSHFIDHAYDCELESQELLSIQDLLLNDFKAVKTDLTEFRGFVKQLSNEGN